MKNALLSAGCAIAIGFLYLAVTAVDHQPRAQADPWATDGMRVLGVLNTPDGERVTAVYVPSWPLSTMCLIVSSPAALAVRCDADAPAKE